MYIVKHKNSCFQFRFFVFGQIFRILPVVLIQSYASETNAQKTSSFTYDENRNQISMQFSGTQACSPLPVKLVNFSARSENLTSVIDWSTSQEFTSHNFEIQHSVSDKDWKIIGSVLASGESANTRNYIYIHLTPVTGNNYYRLKMNDLDGSFSYSQIRVVNFEVPDFLYPNPTKDWMHVADINDPTYKYELVDISGKFIVEGDYNSMQGISTTGFQDGLYILTLQHQNKPKRQYRVLIKR